MNFNELFLSLNRIGVGDVFIPFILLFAIVYAVLQMTKIFGENSKKYNVIIALALAFIVVIPHVTGDYPQGKDVVEIINQSIPAVVAIVVAIVMLFIILGAFNVNINRSNLGGWFVLFAIIAIIVIFGNAAGWFELSGLGPSNQWSFVQSSDFWTLIVIILVFAIVLWIIVREPKQEKKDKNIGNKVQDFFKGFSE